LQSFSASTEGSLPEKTACWQARFNHEARTIWIVDAHGYGKRFIVRADELLTAFLELQRAIHQFAVNLIS
jgi:hypothetical protein